MKLTKTAIDRIKPPANGYQIHWDETLKGFGLRVTAAGSKSFIAQAKIDGKTRRVTIGKFGTFTADQARKMARVELADMSQGVDPVAERKRKRAEAVTLQEVVDDYKANRRTRAGLPLKESTKADIDKHLKATFSDWAKRPISAINRDMVAKRYADRCKASVAQANQAMRILSALINYAAGKYHDADGSPIIGMNPVQVLRDTSTLRSVKPRKNAVPLESLGEWWSALTAMRADPALTRASRAAADCIALMALTGLRISEARSIKWDQLHLEDQTLELTDTKNRTDVTLPLSDAAADLLRSRQGDSAYVFPARSGKGHLNDVRGQLENLSDQTGIRVTAHDLRRTFIQTGFKGLQIELWRVKLLANHKVPKNDVTLDSYGDLSDRRFLKAEADRIAGFYEEQQAKAEADNVVSLEQRA